ncbi:hypothetical protein F9B85_07485 [Heliorestis acidaminivorans]|uniref:Uncharacterized protein n=1 Tax=Heliorestis acidaminivorans TaxID=553427 RepID=A0A6I0F3B8_9FIRM|nr:hypothetical protein [Heliorestis acidaminivorans]KAB2953096.1 hypothetical protein F9B85_07485 [Heliorestis acidaminivorans]
MVRRNDKRITRKVGKQEQKSSRPTTIKPEVALVILGLLSDSLQVNSIVVNRDQTVQIVLDGSLRRKTSLDNALDFVGQRSFEEVMRAFLKRV